MRAASRAPGLSALVGTNAGAIRSLVRLRERERKTSETQLNAITQNMAGTRLTVWTPPGACTSSRPLGGSVPPPGVKCAPHWGALTNRRWCGVNDNPFVLGPWGQRHFFLFLLIIVEGPPSVIGVVARVFKGRHEAVLSMAWGER